MMIIIALKFWLEFITIFYEKFFKRMRKIVTASEINLKLLPNMAIPVAIFQQECFCLIDKIVTMFCF